MDVNELFKERKLRKIPVDENKVISSLKTAEAKLEEARKLFASGFFNQVLIVSYTAMFHASRALLYREGIQEKSHYAVYFYLKEKYSNKIPKELLNFFNSSRDDRHEILYGLEKIELKEEDAEIAILKAEEFIDVIRSIL